MFYDCGVRSSLDLIADFTIDKSVRSVKLTKSEQLEVRLFLMKVGNPLIFRKTSDHASVDDAKPDNNHNEISSKHNGKMGIPRVISNPNSSSTFHSQNL